MSLALASSRLTSPAVALLSRIEAAPLPTPFTVVGTAPGDFGSDFGSDFSGGGGSMPAGGEFSSDFNPDFSK